MDDNYEIDCIKQVLFEETEKVFYMVANKYKEKLGFFILKIDEMNPEKGEFIIRELKGLEIDDVDLVVINKEGLKELVIGYKMIYMNVYNLISFDISGVKKNMMFRHESMQLWESKCMGFVLKNNMDYIHINSDGFQCMFLASRDKKVINDDKGFKHMCHSLESCNYLKIDRDNFILYACASKG